MNLVFLQAAMWPALFLVSLPILLHFFARARPRNIPFSTTRFLEKVLRKTSRIQRPKSWLILILRTLLFAALLALLLQPVGQIPSPLAESGERRQVLVLVDQSASMGAVEGAGTRFARAAARADEILAGLNPDDVANIVWIRSPSRPEFPVPGTNRAALRESLREARPSMEAADAQGALDIAAAQLGGGSGQREIFVLSDFLKEPWEGVALPDIPEATWAFLQTAREEVPNIAISRVFASQTAPIGGEEIEIVAEVQNHSDAPVLKQVFLRAAENTASTELRLPPRASALASFPVRFSEPGEQLVEVTIEEDAFTADNIRRMTIETRPALTVALSGEDRGLLEIWKRALDAVDWIDPVVASRGGDRWSTSADAVLIAGWNGEGAEELAGFLDDGKPVLIAPLPGESAQALNAMLEREFLEAGLSRETSGEQPFELRRGDARHAAFEIFGDDGEFGDPAAGLVASRLRLPDGLIPSSQVLLEFEDGVPAVATLPTENGTVIFWNLAAPLEEGSATTWASRPEFVPFFAELILHSRTATAGAAEGVEILAGRRVQRAAPADVLPDEVVLRQGGSDFAVEFVGGANPIFVSTEGMEPGFFEWIVREIPSGTSAVNFPASESNLTPGTPPSDEEVETVRLTSEQTVQELREGRPLWPYLMAFALLCLCAEGFAVWRTRPR